MRVWLTAARHRASVDSFKRKNYPDKGVGVRADGGDLIIDLHIIVTYGVNIGTIVDSITNKVRYTVEQSTGLGVKKSMCLLTE